MKEPQLNECAMLDKDQVLFTYLHLAADPAQTEALVKSGTTAIAYETVVGLDGTLPLLTPMSEVAGRLSIQVARSHCRKPIWAVAACCSVAYPASSRQGRRHRRWRFGHARGRDGRRPRRRRHDPRTFAVEIRQLDEQFNGRVRTVYSTKHAIDEWTAQADLVVGAVLIRRCAAPKLVSADHVKEMLPGAVVVDIWIDQGGCFETSKPTTHAEPTYVVDDVVHYCVTNMPGAVPRTSTFALTNATLPFVKALANHGWREALTRDAGLAAGLNIHAGRREPRGSRARSRLRVSVAVGCAEGRLTQTVTNAGEINRIKTGSN